MGRRSHRNPDRWTPPTLADALEASGVAPRMAGAQRHPCPKCGAGRPAFALVDVRALPPEVTGGRDLLCDSCWTGLIRSGVITEARWLEFHGAPASVIGHAEDRRARHLARLSGRGAI